MALPLLKTSFRRWCWRWWAYYLTPMTYWRALKTFYQRGRRGYADSDLWDLPHYLGAWMPQALQHYRDRASRVIVIEPDFDQALTAMIEGWDSVPHIANDCDCCATRLLALPGATLDSLAGIDRTSQAYADYEAYDTNHDAEHRARWIRGMEAFSTHLFKVWW